MNRILFITGLLAVFVLFSYRGNEADVSSPVAKQEALMKEKKAHDDMRHRIEVIGKDMKGSQCLTPRRNVQPSIVVPHIRETKSALKSAYASRVKETDQLRKVSEYVSDCQTFNFYALLSRMGYRVYALRKIVI